MNKTSMLLDGMNDIVLSIGSFKNKIKSNRKYIVSLIHMFKGVKDFRQPLKVIYKLDDILCICLILALKGKLTSFYYAAEYIEFKAKYFRKLGLIHGNHIPSHDTLRRIFMHIDANELRDMILGRINLLIKKIVSAVEEDSSKGGQKLRLISGDGKCFNGSGRKNGQNNINVFNVLDVSTACCITSIPLTDKESEIPAFQHILKQLKLDHTMVTADALHCQRETFRIVSNKGGLITIKVKDNQASFKEHLIDMLKLNEKKIQKFHFNNCEYEILIIDWETTEDDFPYTKAFVRMISHKRKAQADYNPEPQYFASTADNPQLIMETIDNRWNIESDYHWFKDMYLNEDSCTFTDTNAIKVMATFNNIAFAMFKVVSAIFDNSKMSLTKMKFEDDPTNVLSKLVPLLEKQNLTNLLKENLRGRKKS